MAVKSPIRYVFDNDGNIVEFSEFQSADFIGIGDGGTGATTASGAAVALGLEIGVDVQAYDVNLDELSALTPADSNFIVGNGTEWIVESGSTVRDSLGLGTSDAVQFNTIQTSNLTIGGPSLTLEGATDDSFESTLVVTDPTADRTITFQDASGTVALLSDVTAQDVDFAGDTGTGAVDLDSQTFTIQGTANEIETSASGQTLTIGLPDDVTIGNDLTITGNLTVQGTQTILETETLTVDDNVIVLNSNATGSATVDAGIEIERGDDSNVTLIWDETNNRWTVGLESFVASTFIGNLTGDVTGDLTGNVTATSVLADGVTATTQSAGDNSTKVATTAYVDTQVETANELSELTDVTLTSSQNGDFLRYNGSVWINDAVDLATDTVGDFVQSITAGDGLAIDVTSGEAQTPTLSVNVDDSSIEIDTDTLQVKALGITNAMLAGSIENAKLTNSSVTINANALSLGGTLTLVTDDIQEDGSPTNLWYTDARVGNYLTTNSYATETYVDNAVATENEISEMNDVTLTSLASGEFLQYNGTAWVNIDLDTDDIDEGSNLFYTTTRANTDIDARVTKSFVDALNVDADTLDGNDSTAFATAAQGTLADSALQSGDNVSELVNDANYIDLTDLSGTSGVTYDNTTGQISIGQSVGTTDNVTFNNVTVDGTLTSDDITSTNISVAGNATITGNLTVEGTTTTVDSTTVAVGDGMFKFAKDNTGNSTDVGFYGKIVQSSTTKYVGLHWDAGGINKFKLFDGLTVEPTGTVDTADASYNTATLVADIEGDVTGALTGNADTATSLASAQNFSLTGDVTATAISFDGTGAVALSTTVTESAVTQHEAALTITESQISDLQSYLTAETNDLSSVVTWANVPDANITESSVTQHEAALSITESQISDLGSYITAISTDTLTNKTINFEDNTAIVEYAVTVSSGNFLIDGEANATISFNPGIVYRFDLSDSSTASHPFALSETEDGTHNSGSEYTTGKTSNGTQGSAGAYVEYTVNAATPDILYYYCSSHSGMGGTVTVFGSSYGDSDVQAYLSAGAGISISGSGQISSTITQYTDSDARGAISVTDSGGDGSLSYDSGTGVITYTGPSQAEVLAHISGGTGITISGSGVIDTTITQYADSDVEAYLSGGTGVTFSSGVISIGQAVSTTSDVTFNDVTVSGDLIVSGTTTTINTETIELADNIIVFNSNATGSASQDAGIEIERGDDANKTLIWNETDDKWTVGSETFVAGTFEGDLTGNVTGNVTGDVTGDVDGAIILTGKNETGSTIGAGVPVYISGQSGSGTEFTVAPADADGSGTMPAIGITTASANNNSSVSILTFGKFVGLDTSSFSVGDSLYVSTSGTLVNTPPTGESSLLQKIAKVTRSHASDGAIFVQGAGRSNAVPNLDDGDIFIGNASNQAVTSSFNTLADARIALTNLEDLANVGFSAPGASEDDKVIFWDNTAGAFGLSTVSGLAGQGEVNTASNIGTAGVGIFDGKVGEDLQFKKLNAGSAKITITDDTSNNEVDIDLGTVSIEDLSDVTLTSLATNELLAYNGTAWVNIDSPTLGGLTLESTDAGSSAAPTIELYRNSASPANADYLGELKFFGETSTGAKELYASITGKASDVTNGATDGTIEFMTVAGGTNNIVARLNENGMLLTEGMDLKFEGATNDSFETTLTVTDPTADRTVTLPDATGTVILSSSSIGDLSDVDITTSAPTDGQALVWNASNSEFEPGTVASSTNYFQTIAVSGQSDIVPDSTTDTLNFAAGANITLTTDASTDTVTIAATGGAANAFSTLAVAGQSDVVADAETDTLTLTAGTGMTITTDASTDTITFTSAGGGGGSLPVILSGSTSDPITLSDITVAGAIPFTSFDGTTDNIQLGSTQTAVTTFADNDADTSIELERTSDDDTVYIKAGGTDVVTATSSGVTITNLTVTGTTTQANELKITDTLFELNADGGSLTTDAGMIIERGSTGDNAAFIWDESADAFVVGTTATDGSAATNLTVTEATLKAATQSQGDNSTNVATTAYVDTATSGISSDTVTDADGDTLIEVENSDADEIVMTTAGQERLKVDNNVSMSARGGFFTHQLTMDSNETFTIASTEGTVAAGPLDIQGTVDVQGSLVVL